jgi:hypothetical protein
MSTEPSATAANIVQSETVSNAEVDWPRVGHNFLKAVKKELDVSKLPFKPVSVTDDKEIEEQKSSPELDWEINDKYYFAVWLPGKSKEIVYVKWGLYSSYEKRDPLFRKTVDEIYANLSDKNEDLLINDVRYLWQEGAGYLGLDTGQRKKISEINNPDFIKHVVDNLLAFANKIWHVVEKNLNSSGKSDTADQNATANGFDGDWPSAGHSFLKAVKKELDISKLPFNPTSITDDKEIEEQETALELDWMLDDVHYFAVWLTGKRQDKITVAWGIYSDKIRNPEFRKMSDNLYEGEYKKYLDKDGAFLIDGVHYYFETVNTLGQEATERKLISEINNPDFIKHVVDNLLAFANAAWPVIEQNLVKSKVS